MLFRRQSDEFDRLARTLARHIVILVTQKGAGHHVREHRHRAEGPRHLERARETMRANHMRP